VARSVGNAIIKQLKASNDDEAKAEYQQITGIEPTEGIAHVSENKEDLAGRILKGIWTTGRNVRIVHVDGPSKKENHQDSWDNLISAKPEWNGAYLYGEETITTPALAKTNDKSMYQKVSSSVL
jgi:hypothetical protein